MDEMRNITRKKFGSDDKMGHFRWIADHIASNRKDIVWEVGGSSMTSQNIEKYTINSEAKEWWTLAWHKPCPTTEDSVLILVQAAMIAKFIAGYEFDIREFLAREMRDLAVGGEKL